MPLRTDLPRVVIVGAGFGGLAAAKALARSPVAITLVDRRNYHLFQPLLYQVATAALSPADIAWPIRSILRRQKNVEVQLGRVTGVDRNSREVLVEDGRRIPFDYLVLATGARHSYFGHDEWEQFAPGLKKIDDATLIRQQVLMAFERAEVTDDVELRRRLLTFVIVGGGPTGVEMAGAIAELARHALAEDFRRIDPADARIILIESGRRLLAAFPPELSEITKTSLAKLGVEVRVGTLVTRCDAAGVTCGDHHIAAATVVWGAGVVASPAATWLGVTGDRAKRVPVGPDLTVDGDPDIFVIGDTALANGPDGKPVPGIAPAAKQMGDYVAAVINSRVSGRSPPAPFRYRHQGNLATIGRKSAVVDFGRIRLSGFGAWVLWALAHVYFLISWRNRFVVALNWIWSYITFQRGARLITGASSEAMGEATMPTASTLKRAA
ncbi:MAG: NAD(P)/FAD-dependent oxidoreductase [Geminicoccaceae bacterium]